MTAVRRADPSGAVPGSPASFLAAVTALEAIDGALQDARRQAPDVSGAPGVGAEQALASLLLLRQVREQLAGWETGLIETARDAGASWADLARPLGVASRQAAERRYLRNRPGPAGSTGEQRVQATRERRAADRTAAAWARHNAADLRRIAGQITTLTDLPPAARHPVSQLDAALAQDDPAALVHPLYATRPHLTDLHPDLAARIDSLTESAAPADGPSR
ncbi:type III effector protein [Streptomyces actinomycinicus]|uniref:Type III effector protein n=1 Tax=Streptomyces actinomycinicus TaxID=1695166 RepID=A0A937JLC1_9ACTN|nr:type III effector protein [Streptomyces actinomycinicus]MBL1082270.1 type III effector protein [Streptomyces actinomycinicus]